MFRIICPKLSVHRHFGVICLIFSVVDIKTTNQLQPEYRHISLSCSKFIVLIFLSPIHWKTFSLLFVSYRKFISDTIVFLPFSSCHTKTWTLTRWFWTPPNVSQRLPRLCFKQHRPHNENWMRSSAAPQSRRSTVNWMASGVTDWYRLPDT